MGLGLLNPEVEHLLQRLRTSNTKPVTHKDWSPASTKSPQIASSAWFSCALIATSMELSNSLSVAPVDGQSMT